MGNVVSAGEGQNPARQAALNGGLHEHVAALTINKVCGSGLKAVMLAAQGIAAGDIDIVVAGGMESMSNTPYLLPRVREGLRMGNGDARRLDDPRRPVVRVRPVPHGHVRRARRRHLQGRPRAIRMQYAVESHRKAAHATREGWFKDEIVAGRDSAEEGAGDCRSTATKRSARTRRPTRSAR